MIKEGKLSSERAPRLPRLFAGRGASERAIRFDSHARCKLARRDGYLQIEESAADKLHLVDSLFCAPAISARGGGD